MVVVVDENGKRVDGGCVDENITVVDGVSCNDFVCFDVPGFALDDGYLCHSVLGGVIILWLSGF